ncbi:hypothetical protein N7453_002700 [Penicillium expansum]|nr:hypothetical protein N7453_002700 [Penicillium expansum]
MTLGIVQLGSVLIVGSSYMGANISSPSARANRTITALPLRDTGNLPSASRPFTYIPAMDGVVNTICRACVFSRMGPYHIAVAQNSIQR